MSERRPIKPSGWYGPFRNINIDKKSNLTTPDILSFAFGLLCTAAGMMVENIWLAGSFIAIAALIFGGLVVKHPGLSNVTKIAIFISILFAVLLLLRQMNHQILEKELSSNEGILLPDSLPRPPAICGEKDDDFVVRIGGGSIFGKTSPRVILTHAGQNLIEVSVSGNELIIKNITVFDIHGDIIATITNGNLWVHPLSRKNRPNRSQLIVYDRHNNEALYVHFINAKTIALRGIFGYPGTEPVIVTDTEFSTHKHSYVIGGICVENSNGGIGL